MKEWHICPHAHFWVLCRQYVLDTTDVSVNYLFPLLTKAISDLKYTPQVNPVKDVYSYKNYIYQKSILVRAQCHEAVFAYQIQANLLVTGGDISRNNITQSPFSIFHS